MQLNNRFRLGKLLKELLCSYEIDIIDSAPDMECIRWEEIICKL